MIKRFIHHVKKWNEWRKSCKNNFLYKIYVFFNPKISPTYQFFISDEEAKEIFEAHMREVEQKGGAE